MTPRGGLSAAEATAARRWPETNALFGVRTGPLDWSLRLREKKLPLSYDIGFLTSVLLLDALPYLDELWRTLRANNGQLVPNVTA